MNRRNRSNSEILNHSTHPDPKWVKERNLGFSPHVLGAKIFHKSDSPVSIIKVNSLEIECNITTLTYTNDNNVHTIQEFFLTVSPGYKIVEIPSHVIYLTIAFFNYHLCLWPEFQNSGVSPWLLVNCKVCEWKFRCLPHIIDKVDFLQALSCVCVRRGCFRCSPMRVLACLHAVALHHSSWCFLASHLLMSCVTDLFEIPITGSRPVGFCFVAILASLSAVSLSLIPLCPGVQRTVT